jgi:PKD repeat protein
VRLTVGGPAGTDEELRTDQIVVAVPPPTADFHVEPDTGFAPLATQFTDQSLGMLSAWGWDFGDGTTSTEASPAHVYSTPGTYTATLTVTGTGGAHTLARSIAVTDPTPVAGFEAQTVVGVAPLGVQFADASSGLVTSATWDFGDGTTSSATNPLHVYAAPGIYTVRLTVAGPTGSNFEEKSALVQVQWPAPVPEFTAGPVTGFAPLAVAFTDLTTGNATSWTWTFGDGSTSRQRFPVKVYSRTGAFTATLTVKGPGGTRTISHGGITVVAMPVRLRAGDSGPGAGRPVECLRGWRDHGAVERDARHGLPARRHEMAGRRRHGQLGRDSADEPGRPGSATDWRRRHRADVFLPASRAAPRVRRGLPAG